MTGRCNNIHDYTTYVECKIYDQVSLKRTPPHIQRNQHKCVLTSMIDYYWVGSIPSLKVVTRSTKMIKSGGCGDGGDDGRARDDEAQQQS